MARTALKTLFGLALGVWLYGPTPASAQYTKQPTCIGKQTLPRFDKHYIKKYCGPTICPGSCFGYFPTKWSRWEDVCPGGDCGDPTAVGYIPGDGTVIGPVVGQPVPPGTTTPAVPAAQPTAPVETAPSPKPVTPKTGDGSPSTPLSKPLPVNPSTPSQQPSKPNTEADAAPSRLKPAPGLVDVGVPQVNIQYPVSSQIPLQTPPPLTGTPR